MIQEREERRLHQIIAEEGTEGFLKIENDVNASLDVKNTIIATGGSAVYGKEAMEHLKSIGKVVYLKVSYESLRKRLGDLLKRGVAIRNGSTLLDLYNERVPMYERYADITVDAQDKGIREVMEAIEAALEEQE